MDNSYSTTSSHMKGSHLSYGDRILIQIRLKGHYSIRAIAREIGCSPSTVSNEITRGLVALYNGRITRYKASVGQKAYESHRKNAVGIMTFCANQRFWIMCSSMLQKMAGLWTPVQAVPF